MTVSRGTSLVIAILSVPAQDWNSEMFTSTIAIRKLLTKQCEFKDDDHDLPKQSESNLSS